MVQSALNWRSDMARKQLTLAGRRARIRRTWKHVYIEVFAADGHISDTFEFKGTTRLAVAINTARDCLA
jgi:hypothetical protein